MESGPDNRVRVVIFGGLYGSQPVGRELVIRLARHLGAGWAHNDEEIKKLLEETEIILVPAVDVKAFEAAVPGKKTRQGMTFSSFVSYSIFFKITS